jgi:hypothetical protein
MVLEWGSGNSSGSGSGRGGFGTRANRLGTCTCVQVFVCLCKPNLTWEFLYLSARLLFLREQGFLHL